MYEKQEKRFVKKVKQTIKQTKKTNKQKKNTSQKASFADDSVIMMLIMMTTKLIKTVIWNLIWKLKMIPNKGKQKPEPAFSFFFFFFFFLLTQIATSNRHSKRRTIPWIPSIYYIRYMIISFAQKNTPHILKIPITNSRQKLLSKSNRMKKLGFSFTKISSPIIFLIRWIHCENTIFLLIPQNGHVPQEVMGSPNTVSNNGWWLGYMWQHNMYSLMHS